MTYTYILLIITCHVDIFLFFIPFLLFSDQHKFIITFGMNKQSLTFPIVFSHSFLGLLVDVLQQELICHYHLEWRKELLDCLHFQWRVENVHLMTSKKHTLHLPPESSPYCRCSGEDEVTRGSSTALQKINGRICGSNRDRMKVRNLQVNSLHSNPLLLVISFFSLSRSSTIIAIS